jgi:hypothetical protein
VVGGKTRDKMIELPADDKFPDCPFIKNTAVEHVEHAEYRKDFEKMYGGLPCPGMHLMFHIHLLFQTLLHHALLFF